MRITQQAHLRETFNPDLRHRDDLTLRSTTEYDGLFDQSIGIAREVLGRCDNEFFRIPKWRLWNGLYDSMDAQFYYCMLRRAMPRRLMEVGVGYSTWFASIALKKMRTIHTVIDPAPRTSKLPRGVVHLCSKVEDVPVSKFEELHANDVLFIDSSHTTTEASYQVHEILPRLQSGVFIHHHDICYPYVTPPYLQPSNEFGEGDIILSFYKDHQDSFEVLTGLAFARSQMSDEELITYVPSMRRNLAYYPGAVWARRC